MKYNINDKIKIIHMDGEPRYDGKEGVITRIDDANQLHGTWGGCALIPNVDDFIIITKDNCSQSKKTPTDSYFN